LKRYVSKPVSDLLLVRECTKEVRASGRGPVAATELRDFCSSLLLKPKAREVKQSKDCLGDNEGVYSWGGKGMWGMRFCEKWT
jgi:hypothetical protein